MQVDYVKAIISIAIFTLAFIIVRITRRLITKKTEESAENLNTDPTRCKFLKYTISLVKYLGALILIIYQYPVRRQKKLEKFD